ncbi:hypothetical protein GOHSU_14_00410 [Gordonia hirsuta DSM 44140 = NBRC 16056]|uniref:Uncharacterized protein n=1 Tax=Gordonia hirsuta DSM 44140 = NBRC 16056 TaxID=1121927 RepID=L7L7G2_9ACTN|nr:hypothetical protein [Gordonia hirsuta]GAC56874.1 hypothetical protein GOHSU_14_00410 [Gordonia hirsuta DSM 44140 = NBRC 16056]
MRGIRLAWIALALIALAFAVLNARSTAASASMGCAKMGELSLNGAPADATCESPLYYAVGWWPLIAIGLALVGPPVIAAKVMRTWMSWLVVVTLGAVAAVGVSHWPTVWGALLFAIPLVFVGFILTLWQMVCATTGPSACPGPRRAPAQRGEM